MSEHGQPLERHHLSMIWGDMVGDERTELVEDIRANGVREPIKLFEGKVLDGWHRYISGAGNRGGADDRGVHR